MLTAAQSKRIIDADRVMRAETRIVFARAFADAMLENIGVELFAIPFDQWPDFAKRAYIRIGVTMPAAQHAYIVMHRAAN